MNNLLCKHKLYISFMLIGIALMAIVTVSCACNCSQSNDMPGGGWNPWGMNVPRIVFMTNIYEGGGKMEINNIMADGTMQTNITNHPSIDRDPDWSPDGQQIVFCSNRDSVISKNHDIYAIDTNGSGLTRITDHQGDDRSPIWSPDGTKIAFVSNRDNNEEIFVMNADGSEQTNLTDDSDKPTLGRPDDTEPAWSPDSTKIAFRSWRVGSDSEIWIINADGSAETKLAYGFSPVWSPDGSKIAFVSNFSGPTDIFVINADGSGRINLTSATTNDRYPVWSPGGTKIAYTSCKKGAYEHEEVYTMNSDGTGKVNLTNHNDIDYQPAWSPDGAKIAFTTYRDGPRCIYLMNTDGSGLTKLAEGYSPIWSPLAE